MMKYSHEKQRIAIEKSAKRMNLDYHITEIECKRDLHTWADKIMGRFFRKGMPVKKSYMMCDTLDMNFFFSKDGIAMYTYSGYADDRDGSDKIIEAFKTANKMRFYMNEYLQEREC